jgi:hypothetical protein
MTKKINTYIQNQFQHQKKFLKLIQELQLFKISISKNKDHLIL